VRDGGPDLQELERCSAGCERSTVFEPCLSLARTSLQVFTDDVREEHEGVYDCACMSKNRITAPSSWARSSRLVGGLPFAVRTPFRRSQPRSEACAHQFAETPAALVIDRSLHSDLGVAAVVLGGRRHYTRRAPPLRQLLRVRAVCKTRQLDQGGTTTVPCGSRLSRRQPHTHLRNPYHPGPLQEAGPLRAASTQPGGAPKELWPSPELSARA
jgi:hypothetical protein